MNEEKKFIVELDKTKCVSYTLNGRKYEAGRVQTLPESKLQAFSEAGVFLIYPKVDRQEKIEQSKLTPKKRQPQLETNPDDKGDAIKEKTSSVEEKLGKPSGVISTGDLTK